MLYSEVVSRLQSVSAVSPSQSDQGFEYSEVTRLPIGPSTMCDEFTNSNNTSWL